MPIKDRDLIVAQTEVRQRVHAALEEHIARQARREQAHQKRLARQARREQARQRQDDRPGIFGWLRRLAR
jgi:hypothetical protein